MIVQILFETNSNSKAKIESSIKTLGVTQLKIKENVWLVATTATPKDIQNMLIKFITEKDFLLITRIDVTDYAGWTNKETQLFIDRYRLSNKDLY